MNQEFESVHLMRKYEKPSSYHLYFIDELNGHLYVSDRTFKISKYCEVLKVGDEEYIVIEDFGDETPRQMKAFQNKQYALKILEQIMR